MTIDAFLYLVDFLKVHSTSPMTYIPGLFRKSPIIDM